MSRGVTSRWLGSVAGAALCLMAGSASALTNFQQDVNNAIDAGIQYARLNNFYTSYNEANGLNLVALLEKSGPTGYAGLTDPDKQLARQAACILIDDGSFGDRGGFYSYYDGQVMMGLSVYARTGGPDVPGEVFGGYDCSARSVRATMDKVVDRSLAAQTPGVPSYGGSPGYWGYSGNGSDSSTTQFTVAGLAAAKGYYVDRGESGDKNRIPLISAALDLTSAAYAVNGKDTDAHSGYQIYCWNTCAEASGKHCWGHGYQSYYGAPGSNQQTASGTWAQLLGTGKNVNDAAIQNYLRWLQNAYSYSTQVSWESWTQAYFYYLWSSSKAYGIIEQSALVPAPGNLGPSDIGTLPPSVGVCWNNAREANRDPGVDPRPAPRGAGGAGYYAGTPKGWYYDYAYRLMSLQTYGNANAAVNGQFPNPNGSWNVAADHAYALLVLLRSIGGACVDTDGDGVCDSEDNCPANANSNQADQDGDGVGDVCDNCPTVANPGQEDSNHNGIGDACEIPRCDVDRDGDIDKADLALISRARGQVVAADDPRDGDLDRLITPNDVKVCLTKCSRANCAM